MSLLSYVALYIQDMYTTYVFVIMMMTKALLALPYLFTFAIKCVLLFPLQSLGGGGEEEKGRECETGQCSRVDSSQAGRTHTSPCTH